MDAPTFDALQTASFHGDHGDDDDHDEDDDDGADDEDGDDDDYGDAHNEVDIDVSEHTDD